MEIKSYLKDIDVKLLAIQSNITYGTAIYERGAVETINESDSDIEAWAGGLSGGVKEGGGSRRRVQLVLKEGKLWWHCAGNPKNHDIFCKHCVAVVLFLQNNYA